MSERRQAPLPIEDGLGRKRHKDLRPLQGVRADETPRHHPDNGEVHAIDLELAPDHVRQRD